MAGKSQGKPFLVHRSTPAQNTPLRRLAFQDDIAEEWLQKLLDAAPGILPTAAIDERVQGALVSLGREIGTSSGPIDNLFLSSDGYIVLVETKLWRNPEARRSVVAQILDYARHVRQWSYSHLEKLWQKRPGATNLWADVAPDEPEQEWVDKVSRNLTEGRMTLLVVGDGIRSGSRDLAEMVHAHPDFPFRLALVELRMHQVDDDRLLVVPDILMKTQEVERAIVRVTYSGTAPPQLEMTVPQNAPRNSGRTGALSAEAFIRDLSAKGPDGEIAARTIEKLIELLDEADLQIEWVSSGFTVRMQDPVRPGALLSLAAANRHGMVIYGYQPWLQKQIERSLHSEEVGNQAAAAQFELFHRFGARPTASGKQLNIGIPSLHNREEAFVRGLIELRDVIVKLMVAAGAELE